MGLADQESKIMGVTTAIGGNGNGGAGGAMSLNLNSGGANLGSSASSLSGRPPVPPSSRRSNDLSTSIPRGDGDGGDYVSDTGNLTMNYTNNNAEDDENGIPTGIGPPLVLTRQVSRSLDSTLTFGQAMEPQRKPSVSVSVSNSRVYVILSCMFYFMFRTTKK